MADERWAQISRIYNDAAALAPVDRAAFVRSACGDDVVLRAEIESLLVDDSRVKALLDSKGSHRTLVGQRIGGYEIRSLLGVGGMGEVYRARDPKLGRDVAIKTLPRLFTTDPDRLARFEREARVLASLNHPHIGGIYGFEDASGVRALVLELVEGDTLAERLGKGPIRVSEALQIARQIAEALEAAHEKGIVHRDLKPANIKLTNGGMVKVLDFGLAKADFADPATDVTRSPNATADGTREGVILGTAAYMSPEQAKARPADKRSDVWAFGVVLYEMLTGRPAFDGETISDVLAKVIEREPDWAALPASTPPRLRELLRRCFRKDPKMRLQAIGDARVQIEELISGATEETATATAPAERRTRAVLILAALSLVMAAALAIVATRYFRRDVPAPLLTRFEITTPPTTDPISLALSSDGRQLAFVATLEGRPRLWVRPLDQLRAQPLAGTEGASYPFWAPDGRAIGFFANGKLKRIDLGSGGLQELANAPSGRGGTWNRDDVLVFAPDVAGDLMRMMARGGTPTAVARHGSVPGARWPQFLPDGRHFLFFVYGRPQTRGVYIGTLDGAEPTPILAAETAAVYAPPGVLLWVQEGVLVAQRFDPVSHVVGDEPIPVAQAVGMDVGLLRGAFAVSATGVLVHRAGRGERRQLTWVDRAGIALGTVGPDDWEGLANPELAPNEQRIAVNRTVRGNPDVWLIDTGRDLQTRFTFDASSDGHPLWSPDGGRVVFRSLRNGPWDLFWKAASGAGDEQLLLETEEFKSPLSWSPDGQVLLYEIQYPKTGLDLWALPLGGDRKPFPVADSPSDETSGQFSPDGRWLAYQSNESKTSQIYVRPFRGSGGPWQVSSTEGGSQPRWRPDGRELFYVAPDARLMAVPIAVGTDSQTLEPGAPVPLFRTQLASGAGGNVSGLMSKPQYAVASDRRFLMNVSVEGATAAPITVVLNWDVALKR